MNKIQPSNLLGTKVEPLGIASWIERPNRQLVAALLTAFANTKVKILTNAGDGVNKLTADGQVIISPEGMVISIDLSQIAAGTGAGGGGFMGEYDKTKPYSAGQTFLITSDTTIAGISVAAGYYGVSPAGTDVLGRTWAGNVPANPTGNAVPQYPLPSSGTFYAILISAPASCLT